MLQHIETEIDRGIDNNFSEKKVDILLDQVRQAFRNFEQQLRKDTSQEQNLENQEIKNFKDNLLNLLGSPEFIRDLRASIIHKKSHLPEDEINAAVADELKNIVEKTYKQTLADK